MIISNTSSVCPINDLSISPVSPNGLNKPQDKVSPLVHHPIRVDYGQTSQSQIKDYELQQLEAKRKYLLETFRQKQPFRVSVGKSKWIDYQTFKPEYNMREILKDEIVIEFDDTDQERVLRAISETGFNLLRAGYTFEYWNHGGKSPHLHIKDLPISHLDDNKRALFKKLFIKKYVPLEYLPKVDFSLTGIHLIALEWANHWKGCYSIKRLSKVWTAQELKEALS